MRMPFQVYSNDKQVLGIMHIAKHQRNIAKVLVMCYGLNGNRVEQHRMSVKLGNKCEQIDINFVRFDYSDCGVSEGDFSNSTLKRRISDLENVLNFIGGCFDGKVEIYIVGFSDGAKIASKAATMSKLIKGIILWNPIINIEQSYMETKGKKDKLKINKKTGRIYKPLFGLEMSTLMIEELKKDSSVEDLKNDYNKLTVFGSADMFTKNIQVYFEDKKIEFPNMQIKYVDGAGHVFSSIEWENEVFDTTLEFINAED